MTEETATASETTNSETVTGRYAKAICSILDKENTSELLEKARKDDPNGYLDMYSRVSNAIPIMLKNKETIGILPMVVYGWMPTILRNSMWANCEDEISILLKRKTGTFSDGEMKTLLDFVNGSYIGVSKLLHFTDPNNWAIWDSNVYAAIEYYADREPKNNLSWYCLKNYSRVDTKERFNAYQNAIRKVAKERHIKIREIEMCIFYVGRDLKSSIEKPKRSAASKRS